MSLPHSSKHRQEKTKKEMLNVKVEGRIGIVGRVMGGLEEIDEMLEVAKEEKEETEVKI